MLLQKINMKLLPCALAMELIQILVLVAKEKRTDSNLLRLNL